MKSKLTFHWMVHSLKLLVPSIQPAINGMPLANLKISVLFLTLFSHTLSAFCFCSKWVWSSRKEAWKRWHKLSHKSEHAITVPAVDFEERNVWCFMRDIPKSQTFKHGRSMDYCKQKLSSHKSYRLLFTRFKSDAP